MKLKAKDNVLITGPLPKSREVTDATTQSGKRVVNFSVRASNTRHEDGSYSSEWVRCAAWGEMAEQCSHLVPGQSVLVCGQLRPNTWTGQDGVEREDMVLHVDYIASSGVLAAATPALPAPQFDELEADDDDLPF